MTMGPHTDDRNPKHWKTMSTGFPTILGMHPPNAMPEEIDNNHPERLRAVLISSSNPVRSFADTTAYEQAFSKLDLLVTIDIAMTETAKMSDYVLPDRSLYERWDTTYFQLNYPEIYCQMRQPIVKPEGELLEGSEIFTRLADKLGFIPAIPESLYSAAKKSRIEYGQALYAYMKSEPKAAAIMPFVVAKTLGKEMGSVNLAWMWALLQTVPQSFKENAVRAGFKLGLTMGDDIFQAILDHPEGLWIGKVDPDNNFANLKTDDNRINLYIPEVEEWVTGITPEYEEEQLQSEGKYPFVLLAGRHMDENANTLMRNPEWNRGRRACTVAMNPEDAERLGLNDQQIVKVTTEAGTVNIELETTTDTRPGMVIIPHGFGLEFNGEIYGVGVNRLTKNTNRDRIAGTPLHRYVRCQVEAVIDS
ncbi:MAG: molybdopterin-dependent oxidoreductase [Desulfosporosinus sp.]|nr:molybdopterin-dependent oxidoreductase [Desulfosporosinus sp.]